MSIFPPGTEAGKKARKRKSAVLPRDEWVRVRVPVGDRRTAHTELAHVPGSSSCVCSSLSSLAFHQLSRLGVLWMQSSGGDPVSRDHLL